MKERSSFISVLRVLAMLSIVAGHLCSYFNIYLYGLGGVGVEIFLAISGYLYGRRIIENKTRWMIHRIRRIMIPVCIWTIILFLFGCVIEEPHYDLVPCLFGIQGISFLTPIHLQIYRAMSHTWFITIILICYLLALVLCNENRQYCVDQNKRIIVAILCIVQIALARIGVQIGYFIIFFLGFVISRLERKYLLRRAVISFFVMILLGTIRVLLHGLENWLYNFVIAIWSAGSIGLFSLCFFEWAGTKWKEWFDRIAEKKSWQYLDRVSYPIYIVHYCFLHGFFDVANITKNRLLQLVTALLFTALAAIILDWIVKEVDQRTKMIVSR